MFQPILKRLARQSEELKIFSICMVHQELVDSRSIHWCNSIINKEKASNQIERWARNTNWHFTKGNIKIAIKNENIFEFHWYEEN